MNQLLNLRQWWLLTACGVALLILTVTNMILFLGNRDKQVDINGRQQYIQQGLVLENLNKDIINALANIAIKNRDTQIINLLAANGVNVSVSQAAPEQDAGGNSKSRKKASSRR